MKYAVLLAAALVLPHLGSAQTTKGKAAPVPAPNACELLNTVDVERVTGEKSEFAPVPAEVGAACLWEHVKLHIAVDTVDQRIATATKDFGLQGAKPVPIAGVGEKAMAFAPQPKDKSEDKFVYVLVKQGRYLVNVSVLIPKGKTAELVQPQAVEIAQIVLGQLK